MKILEKLRGYPCHKCEHGNKQFCNKVLKMVFGIELQDYQLKELNSKPKKFSWRRRMLEMK